MNKSIQLSTEQIDYIFSPLAIRAQAKNIFDRTVQGKGLFEYHPDKMKSTVDYVLSVIKKNYPDLATMGKLDFEIVETKRLSVLYYFVVGKWHLQRSAGDVGGYFTLLFKRINKTWVIVVDHSS